MYSYMHIWKKKRLLIWCERHLGASGERRESGENVVNKLNIYVIKNKCIKKREEIIIHG